jgi:hypothetical protein
MKWPSHKVKDPEQGGVQGVVFAFFTDRALPLHLEVHTD